MARIPVQLAQRRLDTGGVVHYPQGGGPIGEAVSGFGDTLSSIAARAAERQQRKDGFADEMAARAFQARMDQRYDESLQEMPVDGTGFHDGFMSNVYQPEKEKFLAGLKTQEARERYALMLGEEGPASIQWSTRAAKDERDQGYKWTADQLLGNQELMANTIDMNPAAYDAMLQQGYEDIEKAPLPPAQKEELRKGWERMARLSFLNQRLRTDPTGVLLDLRADPRMLAPTTQYQLLKKALIHQESGGNPKAISDVGAIGLMQVMPGTAIEIARELGDPNFNPRWNAIEITQYLSNPSINERYGDHYLRKMIRQFAGRGGLEAALVGYNGGPGRAEKWIESGFDDSVIPAETRNYYKTIMARLPGMSRSDSGGSGFAMGGDPGKVQFSFADNYVRNAKRYGSDPTERGLHPELVNRVKQSFAQLGIGNVKVTSGHRNERHNEASGGAGMSQHVQHNAVDIDVTGYTVEERKKIIRTLSANGIGGIGVGANIIHADIGNRRAWGYARSSGGGDVPAPYKEVIDEHLAGRATNDGSGLPGRFAGITYKERMEFIQQAERNVADLYTQTSKPSVVDVATMRDTIRSELASLEATGVSTGRVDEEAIATVLGEDDYLRYLENRRDAEAIYTAVSGMKAMTPEQLREHETQFIASPGDPEFRRAELVHDRVQKERQRIETMRSHDPAAAAMEFPDVREAFEAASQPNAAPALHQDFVRRMLDKQREFGLKPEQMAPLPLGAALAIGRTVLAPLPETATTAAERAKRDAALLAVYLDAKELYGDYADEVILYSLREYHGVGRNTAEIFKDYMEAQGEGRDIMGNIQRRLDRAAERDRIEQLSSTGESGRGITGWISDFFTGAPRRAEEPVDESLSDEEAIRRSQYPTEDE